MKNNSNLKSMLVAQAETEARDLVEKYTIKGNYTFNDSDWSYLQEGWSYIGWPVSWDDYCEENNIDNETATELMDIYYQLNPEDEWAPNNTTRLSEKEKVELIEKAYDIMGLGDCCPMVNSEDDWLSDWCYDNITSNSFAFKFALKGEGKLAEDIYDIYIGAVYEICDNNIENINKFIAGYMVDNYFKDIEKCAWENLEYFKEDDEENSNEPVLVNM